MGESGRHLDGEVRPTGARDAPIDCAVVGGGVAGALAALDLRARGHRVALVAAHEGASALCAGTWDVEGDAVGPSDTRPREQVAPWSVAVLERIHALCPGLIERVGSGPLPLVVSELGRTRRTLAHDPAMLDLAGLPRGRIAVATLAGHPSWQGRHVARALDAEAHARGEARRYAAVEIDFLRRGRDRVLHAHELAAELDLAKDDPRRGMDARYVMSEAIRAGLGGLSFDAVLVPPILGLSSDDVRRELEAAVGIPIGEAIGLLPGTAGARLMRRLRHALEASELALEHVRVEAIAPDEHGVTLSWNDGRIRARAVILATGKRLGGGARLARSLGAPAEGIEVDRDGRLAALPAPLAGKLVFGCGAALVKCSGIGGLLDVARSSLIASAAVSDALKRAS